MYWESLLTSSSFSIEGLYRVKAERCGFSWINRSAKADKYLAQIRNLPQPLIAERRLTLWPMHENIRQTPTAFRLLCVRPSPVSTPDVMRFQGQDEIRPMSTDRDETNVSTGSTRVSPYRAVPAHDGARAAIAHAVLMSNSLPKLATSSTVSTIDPRRIRRPSLQARNLCRSRTNIPSAALSR